MVHISEATKIGSGEKTLLVPDRLADATSGRLLQKYNEQGEADFELAAIQQTFAIWEQDGRQNGDSIYVYEVTDERLELIRMQRSDTSRNVEIYNPISFLSNTNRMFRGIVSKGDYLRSILHRDWETDLKGRAVCRFLQRIDRLSIRYFFVNIIVMKSSIPGVV